MDISTLADVERQHEQPADEIHALSALSLSCWIYVNQSHVLP